MRITTNVFSLSLLNWWLVNVVVNKSILGDEIVYGAEGSPISEEWRPELPLLLQFNDKNV